MHIQISSDDGTPIYQQIVAQIKYMVATGRLAAGDEVPPIRTLAERLVINPNTVARAYLELERAGIVTKRHGSGTYVSQNRCPLARREKLKILSKRVDTLLVEAIHLDIGLDELVNLLKERHETLQSLVTQ